MEIILKEDIIGLGYKNEIVNVKSGYGRNYLIPTGKGVIASESAKKQLAENLKQQAAKIAAAKSEAEKRAAQLDGVELVISAKVSATGVTYGSVNAATVAEELKKKGIEIDRKIITMHDIKKVGTFEATVHFFKDVEVKLPVTVVAENEPVKVQEDEAATEDNAEAAANEEVVAEEETVAEENNAEAASEEETPAEA